MMMINDDSNNNVNDDDDDNNNKSYDTNQVHYFYSFDQLRNKYIFSSIDLFLLLDKDENYYEQDRYLQA